MCVCPLSHLHPSPSILGMHIFGCKFSLRTDTGDTVPDRKNFDSLLWAIVTVFQVSSSLCPCASGEGLLPGPPPRIDLRCEFSPPVLSHLGEERRGF